MVRTAEWKTSPFATFGNDLLCRGSERGAAAANVPLPALSSEAIFEAHSSSGDLSFAVRPAQGRSRVSQRAGNAIPRLLSSRALPAGHLSRAHLLGSFARSRRERERDVKAVRNGCSDKHVTYRGTAPRDERYDVYSIVDRA